MTRNTRLAFVTNGIALRMLEGGTGHSGQGTAFDEITVNEPIPFGVILLTTVPQLAYHY